MRMIKRFFGSEIVRTTQSAEMFFTRKSISAMLGLTEKIVEKRLLKLKYEQLKGLRFDNQYKGRKHFFKYGLDAVLAVIFTLPVGDSRRNERASEIVDFITSHIGNLCFDEFTSLRGYYLPIQARRAIMAHVCGVDDYKDIVTARFNPDIPYKGSMLRNRHCTPRSLSNPEVYITRAEVTKIKAIDLSIYLLCKHLVDMPASQLLAQLGIDEARGLDFSEEEKTNLMAHIENSML